MVCICSLVVAAMFCAVIVDFFRCERRDQDNGQKLAPGGLGGVTKELGGVAKELGGVGRNWEALRRNWEALEGLRGGSREELTPWSNILN